MSGNRERQNPVFFDPRQKRWPRLRRGVFATGFIISALFGILILSILTSPFLKPLNLPQSSILQNGGRPPARQQIETQREKELREAKQRLDIERAKRRAAQRRASGPQGQPNTSITAGFFVDWDETSISSLKENIRNLDLVIAEWLHLAGADGELIEDNPSAQKNATKFMRQSRPDLRIFALVNNFTDKTGWDGTTLGRMLSNPAARQRCISQLLDYARQNGFNGISIDFENVADEDQGDLVQFMDELAGTLHGAGIDLSINLPANNDSFNYRRLGVAADYVILMAYDEHYSGSSPGPVAGLDWFEEILKLRQTDIPAQKTIVAIGNYAYDWKKGAEPEVKTFEEAVLTAAESSTDEKVEISLDPVSLNPTFKWEEEDGTPHEVWMLDAVSAFNQMVLTRSFGLEGVALWRLGSEDPSLWNFFGTGESLDDATAEKLETMRYGYGLDYEGRGEILQITGKPREGSRDLRFDPTRGFITESRFTTFPSPWVITRYGGEPRKIALTFDDGPDPQYTPAILDELKRAGVPATFFVVGINGERYPSLLRREIAEGHEIGNHTFTHPNISDITETQFALELKATQVMLESIIGRRSYLFRPPFAEDSEPDTPDEVGPLDFASEKGFITVGMQIDPGDWHRPGVDEIVRHTIEQAEDKAVYKLGRGGVEGNVVLLHDSGGDRTETIQALPRLIAELRARGFEFVTVSELMGKQRDDVMPEVPADLWWQTWAGRAAFATVNFGFSAIYYLFLAGIVLGIGRLIFIGTLAILEQWRERHASYDPNFAPTVAVIVPAYNEEKVIVQTITSLLASDHPPNFEIVVVDDGSTDGTAERVFEAFGDEPRVHFYSKPNSGKADALNLGVSHTSAEIVIALDADTIFARDTISKLVRHFSDPRVGAVAGNAKVGNRINLITRWQALEYITSQNLDRRAFNTLNCITVVPGAVGAWRRELVERAGGFADITLAEDTDLTIAIRKLGYSIEYEDEALALTEAPDTVRGFIRQRYRWMYGTLQAAWHHRDALFRPRYGSLGFVALPNIFVFQVLFPLISPAMDLMMLVTLIVTAISKLYHPSEYTADTLWRVLFYYSMFVALEFAAALIAFLLEKTENKRLLVWLFWQRFFYRQLMYYVAIKSFMASLRGVAVGWNKLERKATVKA
jgi:cellulose synthase/poly-beta-1,6-N-acetylglucosamine synthase-like glycosyltransferase/spore germination protein YaaH/peptidoglycan/xylan/chitin deacetylase (PgdA/CDA1 family)